MSLTRCTGCKKELDSSKDLLFFINGRWPTHDFKQWESGFCPACARRVAHQETLKTIPSAYQHCVFENYEVLEGNQNAYELAKTWVKNGEGFLFLYGPPGVGKTHLAVSALVLLTHYGMISRYITAPDFMDRCRKAVAQHENPDDEINHMNQFSRFLLLDDIGIEKPTDFVQEKMYRLIDGRYSSSSPMIITSNLDLAGISARMGERLASRIGSGVVVEIKGDDWRLKHHKETPAFEKSEAVG